MEKKYPWWFQYKVKHRVIRDFNDDCKRINNILIEEKVDARDVINIQHIGCDLVIFFNCPIHTDELEPTP